MPRRLDSTPSLAPIKALSPVLAAFVAVLFIETLYKTEDLFNSITLPDWAKPAIGGLIIGAIGIFFPQVFYFYCGY